MKLLDITKCEIHTESTGTYTVNYYSGDKLVHSTPVTDYYKAKQLKESFDFGTSSAAPKFLAESN